MKYLKSNINEYIQLYLNDLEDYGDDSRGYGQEDYGYGEEEGAAQQPYKVTGLRKKKVKGNTYYVDDATNIVWDSDMSNAYRVGQTDQNDYIIFDQLGGSRFKYKRKTIKKLVKKRRKTHKKFKNKRRKTRKNKKIYKK
jgi:hypothetical protein